MLGEKYDDSVYFSDVSMLRGHVHRIVRLRVWHSQRDESNPYAVWSKGPAGLQCLHNIDGGYMWWLRTSEGRVMAGQERYPEPLASWLLKADPGQVVGIHGWRNGSVHQFGFILQDQSG